MLAQMAPKGDVWYMEEMVSMAITTKQMFEKNQRLLLAASATTAV